MIDPSVVESIMRHSKYNCRPLSKDLIEALLTKGYTIYEDGFIGYRTYVFRNSKISLHFDDDSCFVRAEEFDTWPQMRFRPYTGAGTKGTFLGVKPETTEEFLRYVKLKKESEWVQNVICDLEETKRKKKISYKIKSLLSRLNHYFNL
jgi:hypothetical protein